MAILQEIQKWSAELPAWQRDAIVRLFAKGELDQTDEDDIFALLKAEHGIPDPDKRVAKSLETSQVAAPQVTGTLIQIVAIRDLKHVNAIAEHTKLPFAPTGLTVVYGDNGSGKSGYSRVLKKACRARDQSETIYPDARQPAEKAGTPEAVFDIVIDGQAKELKWVSGQVAPEELSAMSIFDSHCARAYLDAEGDFSYSPYGFDILSGLANLCNRLKERTDKEFSNTTPSTVAFEHLSNQETAVGRMIAALSAKTKPQDIEALATLSDVETNEHISIERTLKEGNPKEKAALLRQRANRFEALAGRLEEKANILSDQACDHLKAAISNSNAAKEAANLAAKAFKETPGLLLGTGSEAWQELFKAARLFAAESHSHAAFPHLSPDDQCPLCQQPLGAGADRLEAFDAFLNNAAEQNAREKKEAAVVAYNAIIKADISIGFDPTLQEELTAFDKEISEACAAFGKALPQRVASIKAASGAEGNWGAVTALPEAPAGCIRTMVVRLREEADALDKAADEKARAVLLCKFKEYDARIKLAQVKIAVLTAIEGYLLQEKLTKCSGATKTTGITNKVKELSEQVITKELEAALNTEFDCIDVRQLHVCLKPFSSKGKTFYKLALQLPGQQRPATILSEGEQRAIALASFLAEVNIAGGDGGVVFDDPVSSLDHKRRWHVARRLAEEASKRQVVVFTHDLYFLCILQQEAKEIGVDIAPLSIRRTSSGFGICNDNLPFDGAVCSKRVSMLRDIQVDAAREAKRGEEAAAIKLTRDAYALLRQTWERGVEEVLFSSTVMRFSEGVSTQKLREVEVLDDDYRAISAGMTKCSKFSGHDGAALANVPTPSPDELLVDIEDFEAWRRSVIKRQEAVRARRK